MPAIYAHDTFGKAVYKELEGDIRSLVRGYQEYFRIGLQGPDFLFFYHPWKLNPVSEYGHRLHEEIAAGFFERAREIIADRGRHSAQCAYTLGVICHFMLDSECHGYVEEMVEETGISHNEIETEFDRSLLLCSRQKPEQYRVGRRIPTGEDVAWVMSEFYENISPRQVQQCLKSMRSVKNLLHVGGKRKERFVNLVMKVSGQEEHFGGIVMGLEANAACRPINRELFARYKAAIQPTVTMIYKYYQAVDSLEPLSMRFERTFG